MRASTSAGSRERMIGILALVLGSRRRRFLSSEEPTRARGLPPILVFAAEFAPTERPHPTSRVD